ncbi:MAG: VOC family protein [Fimbriimonadaceae bacterium]
MPPKLTHVHLKVNDISTVVPFYQQVFDMKTTEDLGTFVFLSNDETHHILALQETANPFPNPQKLYHIAFEVESENDFNSFAHKLTNHNIPYQAVDHGISWAIYFNDPEENGLEIFLDRRNAPGGIKKWDGVTKCLSIPPNS